MPSDVENFRGGVGSASPEAVADVVRLKAAFHQLREKSDELDKSLELVAAETARLRHVQTSLRSAILATLDSIDEWEKRNKQVLG